MSLYKIKYSPNSQLDILERGNYILRDSASEIITERYLSSLDGFIESLRTFPHRNIKRDDIRPDLYITNYKKTTIIAYSIDEEEIIVYILGVFHSSQEYESILIKRTN